MATITNKPSIFTTGTVKAENGRLKWKNGLILSTNHNIPIEHVVAVVPKKKWYQLRTRVVIRVANVDKTSYRETIKMYKDQVLPLMTALKEHGAHAFSERLEMAICGKHTVKNPMELANLPLSSAPDSVWIYDNHAYVEELLAPRIDNFEEEITFFKREGKNLIFGKKTKYRLEKFSKASADALKQQLIKHGAKLGSAHAAEGDTFKGGFKFFCFNKEYLTVAPDGITFEVRKWKKSESIFLPYTDIAANLSKGKLEIYGKQNILSKRKFPSEVREVINKEFKKVGEDYVKDTVKSYFKFLGFLPLWSRPSYGSIGYSEKGIVLVPNKKDRKDSKIKVLKLDVQDIFGIYRKGNKLFIFGTTGNYREYGNLEQNKEFLQYFGFRKMSGAAKLVDTLKDKLHDYEGGRKALKKFSKTYQF